ncbi:MAG: lasso peptide biosynthesis B2 protein, partial [Caldilineaceae bacterium]|nr:lasso peptide biosynthesis B2 protein [Caldilineaceae bacterium]
LAVVQTWLTVAPASPPTTAEIARRLHCMTVIMALGRPLIQPRCLTRGVTLYYFLRRAGLAVDLHFGVSQRTTPFLAHCWLVLDGQPFAEQVDPYTCYETMFVIS